VYPKVSGLGHNEINNNNNNNNKHSLRSNTKGYGGKTHETDLQNSDTAAHSGRELYHLPFSLQAASPETFGYILVFDELPHYAVFSSFLSLPPSSGPNIFLFFSFLIVLFYLAMSRGFYL
jgi:hypothetical protein